MSLKIYATTAVPSTTPMVKNENGSEILDTLGSREEELAVQLQELFSGVTQSLAASMTTQSKLTIEVTGSISLKTEGGTKYLFFNIGAQRSSTASMKLVLETTLQPTRE